jgi:hypothetical protein
MTAALAPSVLLQTQIVFTALFGFVRWVRRASLQAGMLLARLGADLLCAELHSLNGPGQS